jgi:multiple sugar transport system permease protein
MGWTILAIANLFCALLSYAFLAHALAKLRWHNRGLFMVLLAIVICGQTWIVPQAIGTFWWRPGHALYIIWLVNWLVSALSIALLWSALVRTTSDRADAARLDGCGAWGIFRHVVLPLVRPTVLLLAFVNAIGSILALAELWWPSSSSSTATALGADVRFLVAGSLLMTGPLIAIFFYTRQLYPDR